MSKPRPVVPGRSYMITRRCTQRQMLLRPDDETNNAFTYCLAVAAAKYDVGIIFTTAMSNHHHTGIVDHHGNYPEFLAYLHKLIAKCQNSLRGRWENFWASEQTSVLRLGDAEDVLRKLVYAACNPVLANLVEEAKDWPGVNSLRQTLNGSALTATRPKHFFRKNGPMPEKAELQLVRPEGFVHLNRFEWADIVANAVKTCEADSAEKRRTAGIQVLGVARVLKQRWSGRPRMNEPKRGVSPRVAAVNKWRRMEMLLQDRTFEVLHRLAREAFVLQGKKALFPPGTYLMSRFKNVKCAETLELCGASLAS